MIVNTAYPFMGKNGPAINPNIWENGVVNYPYSGNAQFQAQDNRFYFYAGYREYFTLPLKNFTKIVFSVRGSGSSNCLATIYIDGDATATKKEYTFGLSDRNIEYEIPESHRNDNTVVVFYATRSAQYVNAGVMS